MATKFEQNEYRETGDDNDRKDVGFFAARTKAMENAIVEIGRIGEAISHDHPVSLETVRELDRNLNQIKIDLGGEQIPLSTFKTIPNPEGVLARCSQLSHASDFGFFDCDDLPFVTPSLAAALVVYSQNKGDISSVYLDGLKYISPKTASIFLNLKGGLSLGIGKLSSELANILAMYDGRNLSLSRVAELSDQVAKTLSHHTGFLALTGLQKLSDKAAHELANHEGVLHIRAKADISDTAWKTLVKGKSAIVADGEGSAELEPKLLTWREK